MVDGNGGESPITKIGCFLPCGLDRGQARGKRVGKLAGLQQPLGAQEIAPARGVRFDLEGDEEETFAQYAPEQLESLSGEQVRENLQRSGLWTALRTRPFSRVPAVDATPSSIFVTAIATGATGRLSGFKVRPGRATLLRPALEGLGFEVRSFETSPDGPCDRVGRTCRNHRGHHARLADKSAPWLGC